MTISYTTIITGGRVPDIDMTQYLVDIKDVSLDDVKRIDEDNFFLNNGSPHHVRFTDNLADVDVAAVGRKLRWGMYGEEGANVDFVQVRASLLFFQGISCTHEHI